MNTFVLGYYAMLIGCSCLAAYFQKRSAFLLLFSLTLASFFVGILGGEPALWTVTVAAAIIALAAGIAYSFREFLSIILPGDSGRIMRTAPLTAAFGLFVILVYVIAGVFAPVIAPYGEAEVIS
ncbi:MAG: ABC transporter permease, partial [Pseudomonadota bacterium]